jgi:hypothetical protein
VGRIVWLIAGAAAGGQERLTPVAVELVEVSPPAVRARMTQ